MQLGECCTDLADYIIHDFVVGVEQVIAAHARLARNSGGDHDDIGIGGVSVIVRADDAGVSFLNRHGFEQIKAFALRNAVDDVDQDYVRQFFGGNPVRSRGANVSRANNRNFLTHKFLSR